MSIINDPTPKPILEHLEELRWVVIKSAIVFSVAALAGLGLTKPILQLLYGPLRAAGQDPETMLRVLGVADPLGLQFDIALTSALLIALPFVLYFIGQFLLPGLTQREARAVLPAFGAGTILFLGGVAFCYYLILPQTLRFFVEFNNWLGFRTEWTVQNYIEFTLQMLLAFGVAFELPLVLVVLGLFGIVSSRMLRRYRRHTFFVLVLVACCVIPATDPVSLGMLVVPMQALFEMTIGILWMIEKRREAREKEIWPNMPQ